MISFEEAISTVLDCSAPLGTESVPIDGLLGATLAAPIVSAIDSPAFDNSAVDGYCVRIEDLAHATPSNPVLLPLDDEVSAGERQVATLKTGKTIRISTGAMIASGTEAVVMQEDVSIQNGCVAFNECPRIGANIRRQAEEFSKGVPLLDKGELLNPVSLSLMASQGLTEAIVFRRPRVALLSTGNELVPPGQKLQEGQIYESNVEGLLNGLRAMRIEPVYRNHVIDDKQSTFEVVAEALESADVLLSTGGVSVGPHDHVKAALERCGVEELFWKVAIKPGKPLYFGKKGHQLIFGLPGNPVSTLIDFYLFVRPCLIASMGGQPIKQRMQGLLTHTRTKSQGRLEFLWGNFENGKFTPSGGQRSHMLSGLASSNALGMLPADATMVEAGQNIDIIHLNWSLP